MWRGWWAPLEVPGHAGEPDSANRYRWLASLRSRTRCETTAVLETSVRHTPLGRAIVDASCAFENDPRRAETFDVLVPGLPEDEQEAVEDFAEAVN